MMASERLQEYIFTRGPRTEEMWGWLLLAAHENDERGQGPGETYLCLIRLVMMEGRVMSSLHGHDGQSITMNGR